MEVFFAPLMASEATDFAAGLAEISLLVEMEMERVNHIFEPGMKARLPVRQWALKAHKLSEGRRWYQPCWSRSIDTRR